MKELKVYVPQDGPYGLEPEEGGEPVEEETCYLKSEVDAVLDEKDKIIAELKEQYKDMDVTHTVHIAKMNAKIEELESKNAQLEDDVAFWKKKLSSCLNGDCILTCDTVEKYGKENVRLKRALWLARAERANEIHFMWCQLIYDKKYGIVKFNVRKNWWEENVKQGQTLHTPQGWADVWDKIEYKCRAMAEKFGG